MGKGIKGMGELVELRGEVPRELVDVLDAVAISKGTNRMVILRAVLTNWVQTKVHEADLIRRVTEGNGSTAASFPLTRPGAPE